MTITDTTSGPVAEVYRAFWRWHFYAGLIVLPVLMLMALTGGLYLFEKEISAALYRDLRTVTPAPVVSAQRWVDAAARAVPGRVVIVAPPAGAGQSAKLTVETREGARRDVFVDPADARVLGSIPEGGLMQTLKTVHSLAIAGPIPNLMVEIVAGWAIVMIATGFYLWWPRGRKGGVVSIRATPGKRVFWRDLHAVTGALVGLIVLFLAMTGMVWSQVWGAQIRQVAALPGLGRPAVPAGVAAHQHGRRQAVPWSLQGMEMEGAAGTDHGSSGGIDTVIAAADAAGLARPYVVTIPEAAGRAWSASAMADRVEDMRTLYVQSDGAMVADVPFKAYGPVGQAIEWGVAVHLGREYGAPNRWLMLAGCVAVWLLGVSALVMWWKRRPKGRLAAPPGPSDRRAYWGLAAVIGPIAALYPLVGVSLVGVLAIDIAVRRFARAA